MTITAANTFSDSVQTALKQAEQAASSSQPLTREELLELAESLRNIKCDDWEELRSLYMTANKLSRLATLNTRRH